MQNENNIDLSQQRKKDILIEPPREELWLREIKSFAQDFKNFHEDEKPSTPKADLGIGPVKYSMKFIAKEGLAEKRFQLLDRAVNLEKMLGDSWIKVEATLMFAVFGVEDPLPWLPAMQHYAIRTDACSRMTTRFVNRHGLVRNARIDHDGLAHMVQDSNQINGSMNRAEVLLLAQFVPKKVQATSRSGQNSISTTDLAKFAGIFDRHQTERGRVDAFHNLFCRLVLGAETEESMPDTKDAAIDPQLETDPDILKQSLIDHGHVMNLK